MKKALFILYVMGVVGFLWADYPPDQPYSSYWHPNDLLNWSPETDADAPYNRSGIPLGSRIFHEDLMVNSHARANEAKISALSIMYPTTSFNPSQGSAEFEAYTFHYWPYIDLLVMWGGSASEGLILSPSADVIDAGHRNGVPVYGTIFFPPTAYGGQIQWVNDLLQQEGDNFPVADKLIEVAQYYGFDGWFFNQETAGGNSNTAQLMRDFMAYIQNHSDIHIMWYDAMTESGSVSWQNALTAANDMFFQDTERISDEMFLNFWWNSSGLTSSANRAVSLGRSPYDLYAGIDVQANGYNTNVSWSSLFPESQPHKMSLGFYCPNWPYSSASDHEEFMERANRFWVGANGNPANTTTTSSWKGMAHYVPAQSGITKIPFVTNFSMGQGHFYHMQGESVREGDWNNRSLQDVLPTWLWATESSGTALTPTFDWSNAYNGGNCLQVSGALSSANTTTIKLFSTQLALGGNEQLTISYRTGENDESTHCKVILLTDNNTIEWEIPATSSENWSTATWDLSSYSGSTIKAIHLSFETAETIPDYQLQIGQLGIVPQAPQVPEAPSNSLVDNFDMLDAYHGTVRLQWTHSPDSIYTYYVFRRNPDETRSFLGGTPNNAWFISNIDRLDGETRTVLEVQAVGRDFSLSAVDTTSVFWGSEPPNNAPEAHANGPYYGAVDQEMQMGSVHSIDSDGSIVSYHWDFGDGQTSELENPTHTYAAEGTYQIILTVTDNLGVTDADTCKAYVTTTLPDLNPQIAWWKLDETTGSTAHDSSTHANHASIVGATWAEGVIDNGLDFDGNQDYGVVSNYPKPDSIMSVTAWVYARSRPGWASILKNWASATGAFHLGLKGDDGDLEVQVCQANEEVVSTREGSDTPFPLNEWQLIALVCDGEYVRLYRNSVEVGSVPYNGTLKTTRNALGIGMKPNDSGTGPDQWVAGYWNGFMDDIRIYDRIVSPFELWQNYSAHCTPAENAVNPSIKKSFQLSNYPNPFNPETQIRFSLPTASNVKLTIYNCKGQKVKTLWNDKATSGSHIVLWNGRNEQGESVGSGVYLLQMQTNTATLSKKILLLK